MNWLRNRNLGKFLSVILSLSLLLNFAFFLAPQQAGADTIDDIVQELVKIRGCMDDNDRAALKEVRNKLNGFSQAKWDELLQPVFANLTPAAKTEIETVGGDVYNKVLKEMILGAANIYYNPDAGEIAAQIDNFRTKWKKLVEELFDMNIVVDDLFQFAKDVQDALPAQITLQDLEDLVSKDFDQVIADKLQEWINGAVDDVFDSGDWDEFKGKLSDIGLSRDILIETKDNLAEAADPDNDAAKALVKAYLRCKMVLVGETKLKVGETETYELELLGIDVAGLLKWHSSDTAVAEFTAGSSKLKAKSVGEVYATAYRGESGMDSGWLAKFTVTVTSGGGGGGNGGGPTPVPTKVTKTIDQNGGEVDLAGNAIVDIPAGALDKSVEMTIEKIVDSKQISCPLPATLKLASDFYEFGPSGQKFLKPVTITLKYDPAKLSGAEEDNLSIYYCDEVNKQWVSLDGKVDKAKHTVTIEVDHFSKFAVFAAVPPACDLTDIKTHWAGKCITDLCIAGIVNGYPDKTFKPEKDITRAEFTKLIVKILGLSASPSGPPTFSDVKASDWHYAYVEAAAKAGLIKGYAGLFRPNDLISREEMTAVIIRALGKEAEALARAGDKIDLLDEAQISSWAKGYVALTVAENLIIGYPDKTFLPKDNTNRAEAATVICRLLEKLKK